MVPFRISYGLHFQICSVFSSVSVTSGLEEFDVTGLSVKHYHVAYSLKVRHIEGFAIDFYLDELFSEIYGCLYALSVALIFKHQFAVRVIV